MPFIKSEPKLTYNDVAIMPAKVSDVLHRSECNPYDENGMLPLFVAPMSTVVNETNVDLFEKNRINVILPRNISIEERLKRAFKGKWSAFSMSEFTEYFCKPIDCLKAKALIDVANGHMAELYRITKEAKEINGDKLDVMVGNIANPNTFRNAYEANCWGIRCGIGGGEGCLTTTQLGCHYPPVSLISETKIIKDVLDMSKIKTTPKIIVDGGLRKHADIIKALALGADYCMLGGLFARMIESAGQIYCKGIEENNDDYHEFDPNYLQDITFKNNTFFYKDSKISLRKMFYGMASRRGQEDMGSSKKTSEGCVKWVDITSTLSSWVENFTHYLQSAMSYCNAKTLDEFRENANVYCISPNSFEGINK